MGMEIRKGYGEFRVRGYVQVIRDWGGGLKVWGRDRGGASGTVCGD